MTQGEWKNRLYYGDNLEVMKGVHLRDEDRIPENEIDLIYLDPPFNSGKNYNMFFPNSEAQAEAFEDIWLGKSVDDTLDDIKRHRERFDKLYNLIINLDSWAPNKAIKAYLIAMAARLIELHRLLKPTGSIYLHCDPTASHYLKILLDAIFGAENFRNEIIWRQTSYNKSTKSFGTIHQSILFYTKTGDYYFKTQFSPYSKAYVEKSFINEDSRGKFMKHDLTGPGVRRGDSGQSWKGIDPSKVGRHWQPASYLYQKYKELTGDDLSQWPLLERLGKLEKVGLIQWSKGGKGTPQYKFYLKDAPGVPYQDIWAYQPGTAGCVRGNPEDCIDQEVKWLSSTRYPTEKSEGILSRIIRTSCPEGGLVFDPFCGCGTTVAVAENFHRRWIGIDITHLAIQVVENRLNEPSKEHHVREVLTPYRVIGMPVDATGARDLAQRNKHLFENWIVHKLGGYKPSKSLIGTDKGIDGLIPFSVDGKMEQNVVISVKGSRGGATASEFRDLAGVLSSNPKKYPIGILITLEPFADRGRFAGKLERVEFTPPSGIARPYARLQKLTIDEIMNGKRPEYPDWGYRGKKPKDRQASLGGEP